MYFYYAIICLEEVTLKFPHVVFNPLCVSLHWDYSTWGNSVSQKSRVWSWEWCWSLAGLLQRWRSRAALPVSYISVPQTSPASEGLWSHPDLGLLWLSLQRLKVKYEHCDILLIFCLKGATHSLTNGPWYLTVWYPDSGGAIGTQDKIAMYSSRKKQMDAKKGAWSKVKQGDSLWKRQQSQSFL